MRVDCDLLVLAELNPDVVVACDGDIRFGQVEQLVERATITLGSSGAITASAAAALGLRVALCAVVGDDAVGAMTTDLLAQQGVDVSGVVRRAGASTGMTVVLTRPDGDRALLTFPGTMGELAGADLDADRLAYARHVHASSYYLQTALQADLPALFTTARRHGATTSLDPGWDPAVGWRAVLEVLPTVDVFLPNAAEAEHIAAAAGQTGLAGADAARALQGVSGATVVAKLGARGAVAITPSVEVHVRTEPVVPVDTTGAGDNFDAGYLTALLDGAPPEGALALAAACGTISVGGWGGTGRLAGRAEAASGAALLRTESLARQGATTMSGEPR